MSGHALDALVAERDNNHKLYVAALNERDEWKERHHKVEAENQRLRNALADIATTAESDWARSLGTGVVASVLGGKARAALAGTP